MKLIPKLLEQINPNEKVIYRGHSDKAWKLIPSIGRHFYEKWEKVLDYEIKSLHEFKKRSIPYLKYKPSSDIEWLCLMQHHGLATRLLDFTTNPLIALFFATDPLITKDGELIIAQYGRSYENVKDENLFDREYNFAYHPPHITERIIGQQGCFVYSKEPNKILNDKQIMKISITNHDKYQYRKELNELGINNALLFPGIDGICQDLNSKLIFQLEIDQLFL